MNNRKCKRYRDLFFAALYDELSEIEQKSFLAHLKGCSVCASEYRNMDAVLSRMDERKRPDMKDEYWEGYWDRLEERIDDEHIKIRDKGKLQRLWEWIGSFDFKMRRALYPVSAVLLIVLGIFIGKYIYSPAPPADTGKAGRAEVSSNRLDAAAVQHFDNLKPLLVEWANYPTAEGSSREEETIPVAEETLKKLVFQHYLLKETAAKSDNIFLKQLLDELELILLEISNSNGQKTQSIKAVQEILKSNDVLFKMNVFTNNRKTSLKI